MEDEQIIALYFSRDDRAIRETEAAYGGRLLTLSRRILNSREDALEQFFKGAEAEGAADLPAPASMPDFRLSPAFWVTRPAT